MLPFCRNFKISTALHFIFILLRRVNPLTFPIFIMLPTEPISERIVTSIFYNLIIKRNRVHLILLKPIDVLVDFTFIVGFTINFGYGNKLYCF